MVVTASLDVLVDTMFDVQQATSMIEIHGATSQHLSLALKRLTFIDNRLRPIVERIIQVHPTLDVLVDTMDDVQQASTMIVIHGVTSEQLSLAHYFLTYIANMLRPIVECMFIHMHPRHPERVGEGKGTVDAGLSADSAFGRNRLHSDTPEDDTLQTGAIAVVFQDAEAPALGYLSVQQGTCVEILHVGKDSSEVGRVFARAVEGTDQGWLSRNVLVRKRRIRAARAKPHCALPSRACPTFDLIDERSQVQGNEVLCVVSRHV